ncbi:MAG TPA: antibiotic biosynthesis monooxygenase family protein [Acidimicrobiales bacterium]|jgi:quinol monooxygenase YgiN
MDPQRVYVIARLKVKGGDNDAFVAAAGEICDAVQGEPGTTAYDWYLDELSGEVTIIESYASGEAFAAHMGGPVAALLGSLLAVADPVSLQILGTVPGDLAEALAPLGFTRNGTIVAGIDA